MGLTLQFFSPFYNVCLTPKRYVLTNLFLYKLSFYFTFIGFCICCDFACFLKYVGFYLHKFELLLSQEIYFKAYIFSCYFTIINYSIDKQLSYELFMYWQSLIVCTIQNRPTCFVCNVDIVKNFKKIKRCYCTQFFMNSWIVTLPIC